MIDVAKAEDWQKLRQEGLLTVVDPLVFRTGEMFLRGRSGTADDNVYLCSPAIAAVSMLTGVISDPREFDAPELPARPAARPW